VEGIEAPLQLFGPGALVIRPLLGTLGSSALTVELLAACR